MSVRVHTYRYMPTSSIGRPACARGGRHLDPAARYTYSTRYVPGTRYSCSGARTNREHGTDVIIPLTNQNGFTRDPGVSWGCCVVCCVFQMERRNAIPCLPELIRKSRFLQRLQLVQKITYKLKLIWNHEIEMGFEVNFDYNVKRQRRKQTTVHAIAWRPRPLCCAPCSLDARENITTQLFLLTSEKTKVQQE